MPKAPTKADTLLKITTMKASHAKQITRLDIDWNEGSLYMQISQALVQQVNVNVHGWSTRGVIVGNDNHDQRYWLVSRGGQFFWYAENGRKEINDIWWPMLRQIFI